MILMNTVRRIDPNILNQNNAKFSETFLYGKENFDKINIAKILDATIKCLIGTKRFDVQIF